MAPNKIQIERSALGRANSLGDLYDACSDSFLSINIFKKPLPPELITVLKSPSTKMEFHFTNSTKEKLDMMKFDAELSLSFLCGMITVGGSAKFLDKNVNNSKFVHCVLSQKIQTQRETVNFALERIPDFVNMEALSEHVTHVVVGIQRGCNAFVDFCFQSDEETSERDIEGMLKGALRETLNCGQKQVSTECSDADVQISAPSSTTVLGGAGASAGGQYKKKNHKIMTGVKLEVFADIHSTTSSTPQTVEEGMAYIREIHLQMGNTAGETGVPISYELLSLQELKRLLGNKSDPRTLCNELSKVTVERAKRILYEGEEQLLRLTDFTEKVRSHGKLIPKKLLNKITSFEDDCTISNIETREKIHHHVIEARGNKDRLESLHEVFKDFTKSPISKSQMDTFFNEQEELVCLCDFLDQLKDRQVTLIEKKKDYWALKKTKSAYVLFFSAKDLVTDTKLWHDTVEHFFGVCAKVDEEGICAAVHSDIMKDLLAEEEIGKTPIIAVIEESHYATRDLVENYNELRKVNAEKAKEMLYEGKEQLQRLTQFVDIVRLNAKQIGQDWVKEILWFEEECKKTNIEHHEKVVDYLLEGKHHLESQNLDWEGFLNSPISKSNMDMFLGNKLDIVVLCNFLEKLRSLRVTLIETTKDYFKLKRTKCLCSYVLFFSMELLADGLKETNETLQHFLYICETVKPSCNSSEFCAAVYSDAFLELSASEYCFDKAKIVVIEENQSPRPWMIDYRYMKLSSVNCVFLDGETRSNEYQGDHDARKRCFRFKCSRCEEHGVENCTEPFYCSCDDFLTTENEFVFCRCGVRKLEDIAVLLCKRHHEIRRPFPDNKINKSVMTT